MMQIQMDAIAGREAGGVGLSLSQSLDRYCWSMIRHDIERAILDVVRRHKGHPNMPHLLEQIRSFTSTLDHGIHSEGSPAGW